jgi:hypothetical protein
MRALPPRIRVTRSYAGTDGQPGSFPADADSPTMGDVLLVGPSEDLSSNCFMSSCKSSSIGVQCEGKWQWTAVDALAPVDGR